MTAVLLVRPLGQPWQTIGAAAHRGVWHEGLELVSDQGGPKTGTFTLRRPAGALFPDLLTRTPVVAFVDGHRVWAGRIKDTPEVGGRDRQVSVECVGAQAALDDPQYQRAYVHTRTTDFQDERSVLTADLTRHRAFGQVNNDNGVVALMIPAGTVFVNNDEIAAVIDLGPGGACKRAVVGVDSSNNSGTIQLFVVGTDTPSWLAAGANRQDYVSSVVNNSFSSGAVRGSTGNGHRYVTLLLHCNGGGTAAADIWFRFTSVQLFADTAYESADASILTADTGIKDALGRLPAGAISTDLSQVGAPGFPFPDFAPDAPRTVRDYVTAFNAPHNWIFKIDEEGRPIFAARPTAPAVDIGAWAGNDSDQGSSNSDEGVATSVIVAGTGPDGTPISVTRSQTGTIVDRQGGVSVVTLGSSFALNTTLANQLGDTHLANHRVSPFKGEVEVGLGGARAALGGVPVHPARLLTLTGQLARRTDLIDPDTGAIGRLITIDQVTYREDAQSATVSLDNTRNDFDALLARLGLLVPA